MPSPYFMFPSGVCGLPYYSWTTNEYVYEYHFNVFRIPSVCSLNDDDDVDDDDDLFQYSMWVVSTTSSIIRATNPIIKLNICLTFHVLFQIFHLPSDRFIVPPYVRVSICEWVKLMKWMNEWIGSAWELVDKFRVKRFWVLRKLFKAAIILKYFNCIFGGISHLFFLQTIWEKWVL